MLTWKFSASLNGWIGHGEVCSFCSTNCSPKSNGENGKSKISFYKFWKWKIFSKFYFVWFHVTFNLGACNVEIELFFRTFLAFFDGSRRFHDCWPVMAGIVFSLAYRLGTPFFRCIMHTSLHLTDTSAVGSTPSCYGSQAIFTRRFFKSWHDGRAILLHGHPS